MRTDFAASRPQLPGFAISPKTYASSRVRKDSTTAEVQFVPIPKKEAVRRFHHARNFERQTARRRKDAFGRVTLQGKIGRMGLMVLHALTFDFLNYRNGRLDPSYAAIAAKACISPRSVARGLAALQAAGVLHWKRRCSGRMVGNRFELEQETNAYGLCPVGHWRGYRPPPDSPPPDPQAWGAAPVVAPLGVQAGDGRGRVQALLDGSPPGSLGAALAGLSRRRPL